MNLTKAQEECKKHLTIVNGRYIIDKKKVTVVSINPNRIGEDVYEVLVTSKYSTGYKFDTVNRFIKKAKAIKL